jgi:hypothetical protein
MGCCISSLWILHHLNLSGNSFTESILATPMVPIWPPPPPPRPPRVPWSPELHHFHGHAIFLLHRWAAASTCATAWHRLSIAPWPGAPPRLENLLIPCAKSPLAAPTRHRWAPSLSSSPHHQLLSPSSTATLLFPIAEPKPPKPEPLRPPPPMLRCRTLSSSSVSPPILLPPVSHAASPCCCRASPRRATQAPCSVAPTAVSHATSVDPLSSARERMCGPSQPWSARGASRPGPSSPLLAQWTSHKVHLPLGPAVQIWPTSGFLFRNSFQSPNSIQTAVVFQNSYKFEILSKIQK